MIAAIEPATELPMGPALEFMRGLWQLDHALERTSKAMEKTAGVTAQQRMIVRCVGRFPGMTASQLAAQLHVDAGTVSTALRRLERKGLLERRRSSRDRRRVALGLTAAGRAVDEAVAGTVEESVVALLSAVSAEDVACTRRVLRTLTERLEAAAGRDRRSPDAGGARRHHR